MHWIWVLTKLLFTLLDGKAYVLKLQMLNLFGLRRHKLHFKINCKSTVSFSVKIIFELSDKETRPCGVFQRTSRIRLRIYAFKNFFQKSCVKNVCFVKVKIHPTTFWRKMSRRCQFRQGYAITPAELANRSDACWTTITTRALNMRDERMTYLEAWLVSSRHVFFYE